MRVLSNHGLVEIDTSSQELNESRGYSIHGCVHSWTVHVLNQTWDFDLAKLAVEFVIPGEQTVQPWLTQRRLLQYAARCSYLILNSLVPDDDIVWACHELGRLYESQGKLVEAEQMYQRALQGYEKAWGPEHTSTLVTVNNLGNLYAKQGKLAEAEQMYQRALQGYEKAWGPEHISTLDTVNNLGNLYAKQGKLAEAEQMYQRALQGYEKAWGPEYTSTLNTLNTLGNLGSLFKEKGDLGKARMMYSKALAGCEKVFGLHHSRSQGLRDKLCTLDAVMENRPLVEVEELVNNSQAGPSHLGGEETPARSKRHKLFRKLGWK